MLDVAAHSTAAFKNNHPPNQDDDDAFSERDKSDVESLHSLFYGTNPGASISALEAGESSPSSSHQNTPSASFDTENDACK